MSDMMTVQVAQRGLVTLPKSLRDVYRIQEGDLLTLLDLGGVFVLSPRRLEIDDLANKFSVALVNQGESLEGMLQALREAREHYDP
jgi:bifunctional DNA-binding transcriptional regulator/antitoxin component of YhaV-PrlF toxin-antitoxin module